ncbi:MAG TPA: sulfide/dihydroorotate dehydrogenase-like FAD/NAD-binding protein [bacterium]|nr:sulfide/dihydroorotate dehydrogenase-like FAD/NAD-binding protein [bacterium]
MYKITLKKELTKDIKLFGVEAPHITHNAKAGNFIVVMPDEKGERIPLTIYDWDREKGIVYMVFQEVGLSTVKLGRLNEGGSIYSISGPFGRHFHVENYGTAAVIGGGVGVPAVFPIARALKQAGNKVNSIIGFRQKDMIILGEEMKSASDSLVTATNDGSYGVKGFVTDALKQMIESGDRPDIVVAVGPVIMMKAVSDLTKNYGIKTIVSLNALMMDATGMCGGCRVNIGGTTKFSCVDGPDFDGHLVDFDGLMSRLTSFKEHETEAMHKCRLDTEEKNG